MNWLKELENNTSIQNTLASFLEQYGISCFADALLFYMQDHEEYVCRNKTSISRIKIGDILYIKVAKHYIYIYTQDNVYEKYGSLSNELKFFASYRFIQCNQSCIVSLRKIRTIQSNHIILSNSHKLRMGRSYAPNVLASYTFYTAPVEDTHQ